MATIEELLQTFPSSYGQRVQTTVFKDQGVLVCRQAVLSTEEPSSEEWAGVLDCIDRFVRTADSTERSFHYIFDLRGCENIPMQRLHDLQKVLYEDGKVDMIQRRLISSVIIFKSQVVKMALDLAFQVYPPVRPLKNLTYTSELQVARETLEFFRECRASAADGK